MMPDLDVIVPVHNEEDSIEELVERIDKSLSSAGIDYNIIFVDDYSTDNTAQKIKQVAPHYPARSGYPVKYPEEGSSEKIIYDASSKSQNHRNGSRVKLLPKKGKQGKAYSILEGSQVATAPYIAMIDGDLQYPPEAIPEMYRLAHNHGVVVANRKNHETSLLRKMGSKANVVLFERLLLGLSCDTQSGLKVFKKKIINELSEDDVTEWTLDMPLLKTAQDMGHNIGEVDINFSERKNGYSKVNLVKTSVEIAFSAIKLKFKGKKIYPIHPKDGEKILGTGVAHGGRKFITHTHLSHTNSAIETFYRWQKGILFIIFLLFLASFLVSPINTAIFVIAILSLSYFIDLLFSLNVLLKSLHFPPEITISDEEIKGLKDEDLPVYSILGPLYKEANILSHFIAAIEAIDWPKDKLEVLLLLEEDDEETIEVARRLNLPNYFKTFIVPHSQPKTKPKACNFGLAHAKGEFVVVYDAEDRPDSLQLKKAYLAFRKLDTKVVCLQSKLNYYNTEQNLLTRLFTAEYSLWFDLILPGLQSIETTIPLGGTSNHFKVSALKYLNAWDPFNVTEDCDLGARLYKAGFKTAIIDSTTYEEANSNIFNWMKQRSRWIKGYLQTYLVHMRNPYEFYKKHGIHSLIFQLVIGLRMIFILINPILWLATLSYFTLHSLVGPTLEALYPAPIFYIAVASLVFGNFIYFYTYMIGCAKRAQWNLLKYIFLIPFYWILASCAAVVAIYQLLKKPHYWEKTQHGLHLEKRRFTLPQIEIAIDLTELFYPGHISKIPHVIYNFILSIAKNTADFLGLFAPVPSNGLPQNGKLKILIFNWRDTKHVWAGGAEVFIHEIAKRWVKQGHKVTVLCGWDGLTNREEIVDGVQIIRRGGFYSVYLFAFLYYILKFRGKYDLVIDCENGIPFFTPLFINIPKILLIHHVHQEVFRKHLKFPLSSLALLLESRLMPAMYINQPIVTISESSRMDILRRGWAQNENVEIVTPGLDPSIFTLSRKTDHPSFIYLGRLKPYKNVDCALCAFAKVYKKIPNAKLTIAGDGECLNSLKKLSKRLNLENAVSFKGRVSDEERTKLLSESWVALQPSSIEGWGITVIEANASGTPVIASDVDGLKDSVVEGETGILVPVKKVDAFAQAMTNLVKNKDYLDRISKKAYIRSQDFDWQKSAQNFLRIINSKVVGKEVVPAVYGVAGTLAYEEK